MKKALQLGNTGVIMSRIYDVRLFEWDRPTLFIALINFVKGKSYE